MRRPGLDGRLGAMGAALGVVTLLCAPVAYGADKAETTHTVAVVDISADVKENVEIARDVVRAVRVAEEAVVVKASSGTLVCWLWRNPLPLLRRVLARPVVREAEQPAQQRAVLRIAALNRVRHQLGDELV